jgi:hypothetical protein
MTGEGGLPFTDGRKIEEGFIIDPVPRKDTDSLISLTSGISEHILYCDAGNKKYTSVIETYLCDQTFHLIRKKQDKTLKKEDLESKWEKCSTMAVRIRNLATQSDFGDHYYSSIEICKRIQEILITIQKITWANDTFTYQINTDYDRSVVISFVTYDGDVPVIEKIFNTRGPPTEE